MFPQNEFWQCPSHAWTMTLLSTIFSIILIIILSINIRVGSITGIVFGIFLFLVSIRTFIHWIYPNPGCETRGYPGQHYMNPLH